MLERHVHMLLSEMPVGFMLVAILQPIGFGAPQASCWVPASFYASTWPAKVLMAGKIDQP